MGTHRNLLILHLMSPHAQVQVLPASMDKAWIPNFIEDKLKDLLDFTVGWGCGANRGVLLSSVPAAFSACCCSAPGRVAWSGSRSVGCSWSSAAACSAGARRRLP